MKRFIIQPGKICTLDIANIAKQDDRGISRVVVIKELKTSIFSKRQFLVRPVDEDGNIDDSLVNEFKVNEEFLFPDGMCIIRYPSDIPVLNNEDLNAVENAFALLNGEAFNSLSTDKRKIASMCSNRLSMIIDKFKYYMKIQEV